MSSARLCSSSVAILMLWTHFMRDGNMVAEKPGVVSDVAASLPRMANNTRALHLSLGRTDISGEEHIPTLQEAEQALHGKYTGQLLDMLDVFKKSPEQPEYVAIEFTLAEIARASGHSALDDLQQDYADVANGFRQYWQAA
jgi:hypothetical protein